MRNVSINSMSSTAMAISFERAVNIASTTWPVLTAPHTKAAIAATSDEIEAIKTRYLLCSRILFMRLPVSTRRMAKDYIATTKET